MGQGLERSWAAGIAAPVALLAAATGEVLAIPGDLREAGALAVATSEIVSFFWALLVVMAVAAAAPLALRAGRGSRTAVTIAAAAGVAGAGLTFALLAEYPPFRAPMFAAAWLVLAVYLGLAHAAVVAPRLRRLWRWLLGAAGLLAAVGSFAASAASFDTRYPTLHLALLGARMLTLHASFGCLLRAAGVGARGRQAAAALAVGAAATAALTFLGATADRRSMARSLVLEYAPIGQVASIRGGDDHAATCNDPPPPLSRAAADEIFARHAGLPALPAELDLSDYNILFVLVETWRYDRTSLAREGGPTPALARLAHEPDSWWMTRAHSPSVRTWLSVASLFSMTHTSHTRMVTKVPPWKATFCPSRRPWPRC